MIGSVRYGTVQLGLDGDEMGVEVCLFSLLFELEALEKGKDLSGALEIFNLISEFAFFQLSALGFQQ